MGELLIATPIGQIRLVDEDNYIFGSQDNARSYPVECALDNGQGTPWSVVGVLLGDVPSTVIGAGGGGPRLHGNSALIVWDRLYIAVGDRVACFGLSPVVMLCSAKVDEATCFGLHYSAKHDALIAHGELEIRRLTKDLGALWSAGGADIFTGAFNLTPTSIEAVDWNDRLYAFDYETGGTV